jgi:hypothetical protein
MAERDAVGRWTTGRRLGTTAGVALAVVAVEAAGAETAGAAAVGKTLDGAGSEGPASCPLGAVAHAASAAAAATATATAVADLHCRRCPRSRGREEQNNKMPAISVGAVNKEGDA